MSNRIDSQIDDMMKLVEMLSEHKDSTTIYKGGMTIYGPREEDVPADLRATPYPWCHGNPTKQDCIEAGYCRRDPSCGD